MGTAGKGQEQVLRPSKAQLKRWAKLAMEKYRRREGVFLAEGEKVVHELLRSGRPLEALLVAESREDRFSALLAGAPAGVPVFRLTPQEEAALSQDAAPEGVIAVAAAPPPVDPGSWTGGQSPLLLLYRVADPGNLGAVLRTADWFGFKRVCLGFGSVDATHPKVVRTSMGGLFRLAVAEGVDFARFLPGVRDRFRLVGTDVRAGSLPHPCPAAAALLLGSESHGLPESLLAMADERWRIPGGGAAESLSLPQAAAILMYECVRLDSA